MDSETSIEQLKEIVEDFCNDRDWDQFHGAKDLAIGVVTEASELLEHFRFQTQEQVIEIFDNPLKKQMVGEELADVLFFLLRMAQKYDFDLSQCFSQKMSKNSKKYPADQFRGKNHKSQL